MCIHDIVHNRLCQELMFHTKTRSYLVVQKHVRVMPSSSQQHPPPPPGSYKDSPQQGFVTRLQVARVKVPKGVPPAEQSSSSQQRRACGGQKRGSMVRSGGSMSGCHR